MRNVLKSLLKTIKERSSKPSNKSVGNYVITKDRYRIEHGDKPRGTDELIPSHNWRREMNGIKKLLKPHLTYGEMKPFCIKFIRKGPRWISDNADWDVIAPVVQHYMPEFIDYCRKNLDTWQRRRFH